MEASESGTLVTGYGDPADTVFAQDLHMAWSRAKADPEFQERDDYLALLDHVGDLGLHFGVDLLTDDEWERLETVHEEEDEDVEPEETWPHGWEPVEMDVRVERHPDSHLRPRGAIRVFSAPMTDRVVLDVIEPEGGSGTRIISYLDPLRAADVGWALLGTALGTGRDLRGANRGNGGGD